MAAAARMEFAGIPVDVETLQRLRESWESIKARLIVEVDSDFGVFVPTNQRLINPGASARVRGLVNRIGVMVAGLAPLVLLLSGVGTGELVQIIVLLFTALMAAGFFMPVVVGVYWRRATREGAAAAMVGGVAATFLWKAYGWGGVDPVLPGFLCSAVLMFGVSLLTPPPPASALKPYFD